MIILPNGEIFDYGRDHDSEDDSGSIAETVTPSAIRINFVAARGTSFTFEDESITEDMVCTAIRASEGMQSGDWFITTGEGSVTIDGRIVTDGLVEMVLCRAGLDMSLVRSVDVGVDADFWTDSSANKEGFLFSLRFIGAPDPNMEVSATINGIKMLNKMPEEGPSDVITVGEWNRQTDMSKPFTLTVFRGGLLGVEIDAIASYDAYNGVLTFRPGEYASGEEFLFYISHDGQGVTNVYGHPLIQSRGDNPTDVDTDADDSVDTDDAATVVPEGDDGITPEV